jgi:hypothetical protein
MKQAFLWLTLQRAALIASILLWRLPHPCGADELLVGAATVSITPSEPVALAGQMRTRIADKVQSECLASVLALETRRGQDSVDQAVFVACDLVAIRDGVIESVRARLKDRLPGFPVSKLMMSATHTHTAPATEIGADDLPATGVMRAEQYIEFLAERVADAVIQAWKAREPGSAGWGLGHAVVAQNRRAVYEDGRAQMYGKTDVATFRRMEGYEDHGVEVLCFWNREEQLVATAVNVACPAQEVEGLSAVNADFWHQVRQSLRARHGERLHVLGWTGAAGDQSPHLMFRKAAEERMRKLRGLSRLDELARRIVAAWEEAYEGAKQEKHADVRLVHQVESLALPPRHVSPAEYAAAKLQVQELASDPKSRPKMRWEQRVVDRYLQQEAGAVEPYTVEVHVLRLGDIAICTNPFELFTDYGIQMKSRSKALQTFVVQLAGSGTYLPTDRAAAGGGYSAIVQSNRVGPEGGQVLVERTLKLIDTLWSGQ